jgi:acetylornithine/N-succinyldiaminopimelate aminotransferase
MDDIIQMEHDYLLQVYARPDIVFTDGRGSTLYDSRGRAYLDCAAGIAVNALGYADPELTEVAQQAAAGLWHVSNLYHTAPAVRLARLLVETSGFAQRVHFSLCGASANEGAFKFARKYARTRHGEGKFHIVSFSNAFHGRLFGSLAATPRPKYQQAFEPLMPGVRVAEFNSLPSAAAAIQDDVCAVIVEPLQGEGGIHAATPVFLQGLRDLCDAHDALLIFDEVQCGLGRTGALWAWQDCGVAPDLLTSAKPLAGGLPMGAILMTPRVADVMAVGDHASTFAGGPFVAAVAEAVVRRISQPVFLAEVRRKGELLKERLQEINSPHVLEVRGRGLLLGLQLDIAAGDVVKAGFEHGLVLINAGPDVLRLAPPLVITDAELDAVVERLDAILKTW